MTQLLTETVPVDQDLTAGKTLKLFAYKGYLAADIDIKNGTFMNDIHGASQLGCVIDTDHVIITPEAKAILDGAGREGGSFANIMLTRSKENSSIGVLGFGKVLLQSPGKPVLVSRDCDKTILQQCSVVDFPVPQDFIEFIDSEESK